MLDSKFIRDNADAVRAGLRAKGVDFDLDAFLKLEEKRRAKIHEADGLRAKQNAASDAIATLVDEERSAKVAEMRELKTKLGAVDFEEKALEEEFLNELRKIPNLPLDGVPIGKDERENVVLREVGEKRAFP